MPRQVSAEALQCLLRVHGASPLAYFVRGDANAPQRGDAETAVFLVSQYSLTSKSMRLLRGYICSLNPGTGALCRLHSWSQCVCVYYCRT